ncbi:hypothetical protein [Geminisphaera colitermitum]|uniref:hypothetical protein n=1 Tax=Geminisphaera colitermitum TaxID=1148786 RepID=UPI0005B8B1EE|nr:hypothetical protein [Geminisphaera colitermitum]
MSIRKNITDITAPAAGGLRASILKERQLVWPRIVATVVVALILAALASWLRFPVSGPMSSMAPPVRGGGGGGGGAQTKVPAVPGLVIKSRGAGDSPAVREQVALLDPTPLFLPTVMSSAQAGPRETLRGGTVAAFGEEQDKSFFPDASARVTLPPSPPLPDPASGWQGIFPVKDMYQGIGRRDDADGDPLPHRVGAVSVARVGDGRVVAEFVLTGKRGSLPPDPTDALPPAVMEFLVKVESDGLAGMPRVIASSGSTERDDYFAGYLARMAWIGSRLSPGTYVVTVGP